MAILTDDISKLGRCLVGDFYNVEVTTPTKEDYERQFINAYGDTTGMAPLDDFEHYLWKQEKNINAIIQSIENHIMPDGPQRNSFLSDFIASTARMQLHWDSCMGTGRQVRDGVITAGVTYRHDDGGRLFVIQLIRIKLTPK